MRARLLNRTTDGRIARALREGLTEVGVVEVIRYGIVGPSTVVCYVNGRSAMSLESFGSDRPLQAGCWLYIPVASEPHAAVHTGRGRRRQRLEERGTGAVGREGAEVATRLAATGGQDSPAAADGVRAGDV
jgi:hypothetical protein